MTAFILPSGFFNGSHLGPQVLRIPRIAVEFDRNEVILLVMGGFLSMYRAQIIGSMLAWVTWGFVTPGVDCGSG
jgi:hypothetical protein